MEQKHIPLSELLPLIEEVLKRNGEFELHPRGQSMLPTIKEGRDTVLLSRATPPYQRGDLLLYRRKNGIFVLHRVVKAEKDGTLSFRGDNQYFIERDIAPSQVIAAVKRYYRAGKEIRTDAMSTKIYCAARTVGYPFRRIARALLRRLRRLFQGGDTNG